MRDVEYMLVIMVWSFGGLDCDMPESLQRYQVCLTPEVTSLNHYVINRGVKTVNRSQLKPGLPGINFMLSTTLTACRSFLKVLVNPSQGEPTIRQEMEGLSKAPSH